MKEELPPDWRNIRYDYDPYRNPFNLAKVRRRAYLAFYLRPAKMLSFIRLFGLKKILGLGLSAVRFLYSFAVRK